MAGNNAGAAGDAVLTRLRQATGSWHRATEDLFDLMDPALDRTRYRDVLRGMAAVYGPLERAISAVDDAGDGDALGFGWSTHRRFGLLQSDLTQMSVPTPSFDEPVPVDDSASAFGAAYVLEGASMGAMVIVPHIQTTLGDVPCRFFTASADGARVKWLEYRRAARRCVRDEAAIADAERAAVWAFSTLHRVVGETLAGAR